MNAQDVRKLVEEQIGDNWATTNDHGLDLRQSLVSPERITVIERLVRKGEVRDRLLEVWLVLSEMPGGGDGYRIVFREEEPTFGLATPGFANDEHLVLCGWYSDFMTAFRGM
jgi:hypothetical protein